MSKTDAKKIGSAALKAATVIVSLLLCAVLLPVTVINFTIAYKSGKHPDKVPDFCGYMPLVVDADSMASDELGRPNLKSGDLIVVAETDADKLRAGDVIAFFTAEKTVTVHRIVRLESDSGGKTVFRTKGDAENCVEDLDLVAKSAVIGIYRGKIPGFGSIVARLRSRTVAFAFVLAPIAAMIAFQIAVWFAIKKIKALRAPAPEDKLTAPEEPATGETEEKTPDSDE